MQLAAILIAGAALGGITMLVIRLGGAARPPTWLALGHGAMAVCGLATLGYAAVTEDLPTIAHVALGVFVLAALGGLTIFVGFHLKRRPLPIPFVLGHGAIALTGFILLLIAIYRG